MKQILFSLSMVCVFLSCKSKTNLVSNTPIMESQIQPTQDSILVTIEALDISEDMSRFSSKNDEILVIIYEIGPKSPLEKPLYSFKKVLSNSDKFIHGSFNVDSINHNSEVLFLLLEQDSETPLDQIDAIFRIHYKSIIEAFDNMDYLEIEKYLGNEDLMGYKVVKGIRRSAGFDFDFKGVYKLDKFHYRISLGH